jgi:DNA-binding GntR family transcriptional regulator
MLTQTASPAGAAVEGLGGTSYRRVHKAILADIVNGNYAPGARLKVAELSRRYGLSPMPIREALQQLQGEGFVIMSPNRGASVRPIDRRFVADVYEIRSALYTIIYGDAIKGADAVLDEALVAIQNRFDALVERSDIGGCHEQNRLLHATIEARCRNREVANLIARYSNLTSSLRDVFGYNLDRLRQISEEHWMIIEAIRERDADKTIAAAQYHVRRAFESMSQYIPAH